MSTGSESARRRRSTAILAMLVLIGVTAWFVGGCSSNSQKPAERTTSTTSEATDGDVHVKVDLPDTITIKP